MVVGAGVVGLAIARALARKGQSVMLLERHDRVGTETSSRSSEVIHAGIYYAPGSLRAELCVDGKELLYRFCAENGVAHRRCGKLLVATRADEIGKLEAIAANAAVNGVDDLKRLTADDVREIEPQVACVAAYLSPSTGIIDSHGLMQAWKGTLPSFGGEVVLNMSVTGITRRPTYLPSKRRAAANGRAHRRRSCWPPARRDDLGRMLSYRAGYVVDDYRRATHYAPTEVRRPLPSRPAPGGC